MCYQLSCRKDQPRQRCTDCLKTKRRNASAFLEQLRWSNQAPAGKCKTLRRNRRNPIQVSLYSKSNIALFHIIINNKWFLMSILGFPGCLAPSQTDVQWNWSGQWTPHHLILLQVTRRHWGALYLYLGSISPSPGWGPQVTCWTCSWPWQGRGGQLLVTSIPCLYVVLKSWFWNIDICFNSLWL